MSDFLTVLLLAGLPAAANFGGGLLAEVVPESDFVLSLALHAAAGRPDPHRGSGPALRCRHL